MNKEGFTLIELLAVIVILAIIALIATPIVLNIIKDSRDSSGLRSAEMYLDAVEQAVSIEKMDNTSFNPNSCEITNGDLICDEDNENPIEVKVNGGVPESGTITFENGKIVEVKLKYSNNKTIVMNDDRKLVYSESESIPEGTLAYSILANYGGVGEISTLSAEWKEGTPYTTTMWSGSSVKHLYGTEYILDKITGKYTLTGILTESTISECVNQTKSCGKYMLSDNNSTLIEVTKMSESGSMTLKNFDAENVFSKIITDEFGVYKTQDDLGDSYYFRGAPTNNYVKFGTYSEDTILTVRGEDGWTENTIEIKVGTPMYWRIVRINGDGSVRLIYDGIEKIENGVSHIATIASTAYNTNYNNLKYVGYTYNTNDTDTTQVDSTIKGVIDTWYDKHLEKNYGAYIEDSIFCNDRQLSSNSEEKSKFVAYERLETNKIPSLKCTNKEDRYTVNDTANGNGFLSNPVGLITADEVVFAGSYYLDSYQYYWTSTPSSFEYSTAVVWGVYGSVYQGYGGNEIYSEVYDIYNGVRPVINLKADVEFTGNGTIDDPYVILTD